MLLVTLVQAVNIEQYNYERMNKLKVYAKKKKTTRQPVNYIK